MDPKRLILSGPATRAEIGSWITAVGEDHPVEEVTCLLCKGTDHFPPSCRTFKRKTLMAQPQEEEKDLEGKIFLQETPITRDTPVGREGEGADTEEYTCYECGQVGHPASHCPVVEYVRSHSSKMTLAKEDLSHIICMDCEGPLHWKSACPHHQEDEAQKMERAPKKDLSKVMCFRCRKPGHYAIDCTEPKCERPARLRDPSKLHRYKCRIPGHFARDCPEEASKEGNPEELNSDPLNEGHENHIDLTKDEEAVEEKNEGCNNSEEINDQLANLSTTTMKDLSEMLCYRCQNLGHYAGKCTAPKSRRKGTNP